MKIKIFLYILISALFLAGCNDSAVPAETSDQIGSDTVPETQGGKTEYTIGGAPISEYTLVIPENADNDERYAARLIRDAVFNSAQINLKMSKTVSGKAILIGKTEKTPEGFSESGSYALGMQGGDVIVCGGGGLTVKAARLFVEKLNSAENGALSFENAEITAFESLKLPPLSDFGEKPIALADQKNASIAVYDIASGTPELKYEFKPQRENGFTLNGYANRIDEARLRYSAESGTYVIGFTSSSGYCAIASYPQGKCIWQASLMNTSPHSIEYIPGGLIAVASSGGSDTSKGFVRLYAPDGKSYAEAKLVSAHGLLWDEERELLWALGGNDIVAYEVSLSEGRPALRGITLYSCSQVKGGHDLSAFAGDTNKLWIGGSTVQIYDKATGKLSSQSPASLVENSGNVKCICSFPDGSAALTVATGVYASHDTDRFKLFIFEGSEARISEFIFDGRAFYKARAFIASYK